MKSFLNHHFLFSNYLSFVLMSAHSSSSDPFKVDLQYKNIINKLH